ncbi:MAG: HTH-type transcriptional repressor FabR [Hydrogenophaga sp.]|uniref:HTH-type transcriptional repressor FabR n=1 Tax=Hydrogenophaga sp. TaxID=1904254 RepID=UPI0027682CB6|nr:HTH-type transcriptional repressor FabR [Hydrogenophaga sp.]MDP2417536.1 HTH-type transcriptional repressor FabR [Hydrogenophaga sp.]MDZ4190335.1 HTH-type transcriptional repressor FabR [Hydrogenophaga sp.]
MSSQKPTVQPGSAGRKQHISRDDIIDAALKLLGPNRSVSTLSLREVAREAGMAPNSFYRHFRDMDELAVALIDLAGASLRQIIGEARQRARSEHSVVQSCTDAFMARLHADDPLLHIFLREGTVGSAAFKQAVERQLNFFEDELRLDLISLASVKKTGLYEPALTAKAITRLVFAMGATALDLPPEQHQEFNRQIVVMVRMVISGTQVLAKGQADNAAVQG